MKVLALHGTFSEDQAKFYVSEVLKGLKALHSQNILFRDLKVIFFFVISVNMKNFIS